MTYRPDIDGLRAVAVVSVVLFHAFPGTFAGGYIGVDVFFVISGFLIASVLFGQNGTAPFSIKNFYARRIRRIFPALTLVLVSTLVAGWFILIPSDLGNLGKHTLGGAGFVSNLVLWSEAGYFDTAAELKPLLHLWSLGIEEQFYIVFPLFIVLLRRFRWNRTLSIAVCLVGSLAFSIVLTPRDQSAAFYNPLARVWEILIGVLLADLMTKETFRESTRRIRHSVSSFGALLVLGATATFNDTTLFPSWRALFPTVGAALLIYAGPSAIVNRFVLTRRIMVGIGLVSYPLYLWHWPLLVLSRIENGSDTSVLQRLVLVLVSFGLAYATYRLVEQAFRYRIRAKRAVAVLVSAMTVLAAGAKSIHAFDGFPGRFPVELRELANFKTDFLTDALSGSCWVGQVEPAAAFDDECFAADQTDDNWMVWGDSHAARLTPGLRLVAPSEVVISQLTRSSCPPILDTEFAECQESNDYVLSRIERNPPDVVILFGRWETYINNNSPEIFSNNVALTVERLKVAGVQRIILAGPAPFWEGNLPANMVDFMTKSGSSSLPLYSDFRLTTVGTTSESQLKQLTQSVNGLEYVSIIDYLCNSNGCLVTTNGQVSGLTTWDYGHLTTAGATFVGQKLTELLE